MRVGRWFLAVGAAVGLLHAPDVDLRITDSTGTQVTVTRAIVDYGGFFSADRETDGIRVLQGDGVALLKWSDVDTLRVVSVDSAKPPRVDLALTLRNRRRIAGALFTKGNMKLTGRSELGDYAIDLQRIRIIVPIR